MTEEELKQKYCCRCVNSDEKFNCIAKQEAPFDSFICDNGEMFEDYEKEITKAEFIEISNTYDTYFQNGVIFSDLTDNVIAFENLEGENFTYWKIER